MYAVIKTGGKQYPVAPAAPAEVEDGRPQGVAVDFNINVEKLNASVGETVVFHDVLAVVNDVKRFKSNVDPLDDVWVEGVVVDDQRDDKKIAFVKRRRKNSRRKKGHRQPKHQVRITAIVVGGMRYT